MRVVLDTSAWYAHVVKEDNCHKLADEFLAEDPSLLVLSTVFVELTALLRKRHGKRMAVETGEVLREAGVVSMDKDQEAMAWKLFKESESQVSYVDCSVVLMAQKLEIPVFGFDRHFSKLNVEVVPYENTAA